MKNDTICNMLAVWKYWRSVGTASTLTSRPAKQRMSLKPKSQTELEYDVAVPVIQHNHMFGKQLVYCK